MHRIRRLFYRLLPLLTLAVLPLFAIAQTPTTFTDSMTGTAYRLERYVSANFPVGMVFLPDGSLLYNEKTTGNVRLVRPDGTTQPEPVLNMPTDALQERGMLGITLDPDFENNRIVYVVHTALGTARDWPANRLVRFVLGEDGIAATEPEELLRVPIDNGNLLHNGGNVHFDEDGYLYISFGDYGEERHGQDLTTPQAALHRFAVTDEGLVIPEDNPFGPDNSIYAYGLRNTFDFTFDSYTGNLFGAEVGPSCDDEINLIVGGFNYGWRENYECSGTDYVSGLDLYAPPLLSFSPVEAPAGIIVYDGEAFPEWQENLFFCNWNFGNLRRAVLNETHTRVESVHEIDLGGVKCRIDLVTGPDGGIYFGTVGDGDGAIMRLVPADS